MAFRESRNEERACGTGEGTSDSGLLGRKQSVQMSEGEKEERACKHVGLEGG